MKSWQVSLPHMNGVVVEAATKTEAIRRYIESRAEAEPRLGPFLRSRHSSEFIVKRQVRA